jgi:hypothetical protein
MTTDTAHMIYAATVKQIAGLEAERDAHLLQIEGLLEERNALRDQNLALVTKLAEARQTAEMWRRAYSGEV